MSFAFEPAVPPASLLRRASWEELDARLGETLGRPAVAVPSVRVGILWLLQHLGLDRHRDELLVPRYLSRCVLNAVEAAAHPAYEKGPRTRAALLVPSFGRRIDWERERRHLGGIPVIEDASDAVWEREDPGGGSLGKFLALSKLLPALKGGCFLTEQEELAAVMRRRRSAPAGAASWVVGLALALNRRGTRREGAALVEAAYALYPFSPSDNAFLRGCLLSAVEALERVSSLERARLERLKAVLGGSLLASSGCRLLRAAPVRATAEVGASLRACGFEDSLFHVDLESSLAAPRFERAHLIPLHPGVPKEAFDKLLSALGASAPASDERAAV